MRKRQVRISTVALSAQARKNILQVVASNRLTYGPFTQKFESEFARVHERKFAIALNSGTSGLMVALQAMKEKYGWHDNDEVLVPAVTFIATSNVVLHCRLKPIFVDIEDTYYCMDPAQIERHITRKTRAIIPVHLFGQSADMDAILTIAKKHKLKVLEDSAETMFVNYHGKPVGSRGDASVYSTYVAHIISTGVGGIITTNDLDLATRMKSLIFHGRDNVYLSIDDGKTDNPVKLNSLVERRFQFIHVGHSLRLTEFETAIGVAELARREQIIKKRRQVGLKMTQALSEFLGHFQLPSVRPESEHIYMLYPILIKNPKIDKHDLLMYMEKNGIETRLFFPLLSQPIYIKLFGDIEDQFPIAQEVVKNGFIIGSHETYTQDDILYVADVIREYLKGKGLL